MSAPPTDHRSISHTPTSERETEPHALFVRIWAGFGIALFVATWKLWTPQQVFPQIPLFEFATTVPSIVDWVAFAGVLISLVLVLLTRKTDSNTSSWPFVLFVATLFMLFSLDQHRLQPWAWHWFVFALILSLVQIRDAIFWFRWIVISIYVYSAVSKFDYQFTHSVGLEMLHAITSWVGIQIDDLPVGIASRVVSLFPATELLIGIGLMFRAMRVVFGWVAIMLHVGLMMILGPCGLGHQSPVLVWNAFFAVQAYWLFVRHGESGDSLAVIATKTPVVSAFALMVIVFPATCSFGGCDHWLAWELYAPRSSRVTIQLPASSLSELPDPAASYAIEHPQLPGVVALDLARWSLQELNVPVYPQARFQFGVAQSIAEFDGSDRNLRIIVRGRSDRWTGDRSSHEVRGAMERSVYAARFWLNTKPRSFKPSRD
jgi:hypothetical protein